MHKRFICTKCPKGCEINVTADGGKPLEISGYSCKAGLAYAKSEMEDPRRTLTTTVKILNGPDTLLPVKSRMPIPKTLILSCMKSVNAHTASAPVKIGDVVIKDILNTGIDMIATKTVLHINGFNH